MKKAALILTAILLMSSMVWFSARRHIPKVAERAQVAPTERIAAPMSGTVEWWDKVMTAGEEAEYLESEYKYMGMVVGPVAKATERWLGAVAPDLVYVESSKCGGNVTAAFSRACEIKLSERMEKIAHKCSGLRSDDVRPCVVKMDPDVAKEEQEMERELKQ